MNFNQFIRRRLLEGVESEGYMEGAVEWLYNKIVATMLSLHEDELAEGTQAELAEEFGISITNGGDRVIMESSAPVYVGHYSANTKAAGLDWTPGASFYMELVPVLGERSPDLDFLYSIGGVDFGEHVKGIEARVDYHLGDLDGGDWQLNTRDTTTLMFKGGVETDEYELAELITASLLDYEEWFSAEEIISAIEGAEDWED